MPPMSDEQVQRELVEMRIFAAAYRAAEIAGTPVEEVSHAGWRAGARFGAGADRGEVMIRNESGVDGTCVFRGEQDTLFTILSTGFGGDFTERPYAIMSRAPAVTGTLAPGAARLELVTEDGTVHPAHVAAGTFAVDLDLSRTRVDGTAPVEDKMDAIWAGSAEATERLRACTVRVFDGSGALLYEGPAITDGA